MHLGFAADSRPTVTPAGLHSGLGVAMPHLQFLHGDRPLFLHVLRSGRTVLGRSDRCDVALPSESVSRVHCTLELRADGWWLTDRSRHGTRVNGERVEAALLAHADEIGIGEYTVRFSCHTPEDMVAPTATNPMAPADFEEVVEGDEEGLTTGRAALRFTRGSRSGDLILLNRGRTTLGGPGAQVDLGPGIPLDAARIRVVRGRVMVEPGEAAVLLAGARVRSITPALAGEEIRLGEHAFQVELHTEREAGRVQEGFGEMVGRTEPMRRLFGVLARMAAHEQPVLLCGESGTGKELAARGLHEQGVRQGGPFVAVNCAGVPDSLFESELFGHEKGAFTGAANRQDGAFQRADKGTLFLDEVGELRLEAQAKLLRALESGEVRRIGAAAPEFPDVRIVAATNRDLPRMVQAGTFRADLYFRLAVLTVRLPPLRERPEDIGPIARAILRRQHPEATLTEDAIAALQRYEWPGNARELRNVLTRAVVLGGPVASASSLSFNPWSFDGPAPTLAEVATDPERDAILAALQRRGGNRTQAALDLGMPRSSLLYKMKKHGIDQEPA
jgi:DNA-binding NtrC family response regulator